MTDLPGRGQSDDDLTLKHVYYVTPSALPRFAPLAHAEDTPVVQRLLASARVANIDIPRLYTYVLHGANTTPRAQFEYRWSTATDRFIGLDYHVILDELRPALGLPGEDSST